MITREDFDRLAEYAFSPANPGYKPTVREAPNGDGVWDEQKEYAHLAPKYFHEETPGSVLNVYKQAMWGASEMCAALSLECRPGQDSTMRLLRYPPGATTAPHTDFDLFTLSLYRSHPEGFQYLDDSDKDPHLTAGRILSPGIHYGELMTEICGVPATRHATAPLTEWSYSAVFFVIPDHVLRLPSGLTVGEWLKERIARSRKAM